MDMKITKRQIESKLQNLGLDKDSLLNFSAWVMVLYYHINNLYRLYNGFKTEPLRMVELVLENDYKLIKCKSGVYYINKDHIAIKK